MKTKIRINKVLNVSANNWAQFISWLQVLYVPTKFINNKIIDIIAEAHKRIFLFNINLFINNNTHLNFETNHPTALLHKESILEFILGFADITCAV